LKRVFLPDCAKTSGQPADKIPSTIRVCAGNELSVTNTSLSVLNGELVIVIERSKVQPGQASFFTMHCELDEDRQMRRLHFVFAPSKLSALKPSTGA